MQRTDGFDCHTPRHDEKAVLSNSETSQTGDARENEDSSIPIFKTNKEGQKAQINFEQGKKSHWKVAYRFSY